MPAKQKLRSHKVNSWNMMECEVCDDEISVAFIGQILYMPLYGTEWWFSLQVSSEQFDLDNENVIDPLGSSVSTYWTGLVLK